MADHKESKTEAADPPPAEEKAVGEDAPSTSTPSSNQPKKERKRFPCGRPGCIHAALSRYHLKVHWDRHDGIRRFRCNLCAAAGNTAAFVINSELQSHIKTHSIKTDAEAYAQVARKRRIMKVGPDDGMDTLNLLERRFDAGLPPFGPETDDESDGEKSDGVRSSD